MIPRRVLLCLKRALRIANAAQQMSSATRGSNGPMTLFVEILNKYVLNCKHVVSVKSLQTHSPSIAVEIFCQVQ